jgi:hypothetical protein
VRPDNFHPMLAQADEKNLPQVSLTWMQIHKSFASFQWIEMGEEAFATGGNQA